jgi:hypothetical protein
MDSSAVQSQTAVAKQVTVTNDTLAVELSDGRTISVPVGWYPRLAHATMKERNTWRLVAAGRGIHWPAVDEDISVVNLLAGQPSSESQDSLQRWLDQRAKANRRTRRADA